MADLNLNKNVLQGLVVEAVQGMEALKADRAMPPVDVSKSSGGPGSAGTIMIESARELMGDASADYHRALGADPRELPRFGASSVDYSIDKILSPTAWVAHEEEEDSAIPVSRVSRLVRKCTRATMLQHERTFANFLMGAATGWETGNLTALSGTPVKLSAANAKPLDVFDKLADVVRSNSNGVNRKNYTLGLSYDLMPFLRRNEQLLGLVGSAANGAVFSGERQLSDDEVLRRLVTHLGIKDAFFLEALYESAAKGATSSVAEVASDTAWMGILGSSDIDVNADRVDVAPVAALQLAVKPGAPNITGGDDQVVAPANGVNGGLYRTLVYQNEHKTRIYGRVEIRRLFKAIDTTLGYRLTDCV